MLQLPLFLAAKQVKVPYVFNPEALVSGLRTQTKLEHLFFKLFVRAKGDAMKQGSFYLW